MNTAAQANQTYLRTMDVQAIGAGDYDYARTLSSVVAAQSQDRAAEALERQAEALERIANALEERGK